ncbi:MAG: hypothetical protein IJK31_04590 [Ruminococcus sp.]|nr:hypothetical protein [Ruminococcus sp.]
MKRKEKEALKKAFGIPEPLGADAFFERPEFAEKKEADRSILLFHRIPAALRYGSIALAAVAVIGVWGGVKNWAKTDKFDKNDESVVVETTSSAEPSTGDDGNVIIVTTTGDSTVVDIVTTTAEPENNVDITTTLPADDDPENGTTAAGSGAKRTTAAKPGNGRTTTTSSRTSSRRTTTTAAGGGHRITTTTAAEKPPAVQTTTKRPSVTVVTTVEDTYPTVIMTTTVQADPQPDSPSVGGVNDYTVSPYIMYNVSDKVVDASTVQNGGSGSIPKPSDPIEGDGEVMPVTELVKGADQILMGVIEEIIYTSENGYPVTQVNIRVTQPLYSYLEPGDMISIRSSGGYIPVKDYAPARENGYPSAYRDYYVMDYRESQYIPEMWSECVFFLKQEGRIFKLCTDDAESVYCDFDGYGRYECWADSSFGTTYRKIIDAINTYK